MRSLIDQEGVEYPSAGGYTDTKTQASNDTKDGRSSIRRIENVLYPTDLSKVVESLNQQTDSRICSQTTMSRGLQHAEDLLRPPPFTLWTSPLRNTYRDRAKRVAQGALREPPVIRIGVVHD